MDKMFDVIIVGAGSAGCSAAIYSTRYGLNTLLLSGPMPGGLISTANDVENYPGILSIDGPKLANDFVEHAKSLGAKYKIDTVESIKKRNGIFTVKVSSGVKYMAKSVILATGTNHRKLGIEGEEKYTGKGVSYCVTCDGPLFKGKDVVVIGGGNSAVEGVQDLSKYANKVYLIYRDALKAAPIYIENMRKTKNIVEVPKRNVVEIIGEQMVKSVKLDKKYKNNIEIKADAVFIEIGFVPNNELAKSLDLSLTKYGYVKVDQSMGTSCKGIFCAGDLNNASNGFHQQVTSAAEGAIAAQSVYRVIKGIDHIIY